MINKILFITLSNIGDVILTLPALDYLKESFPQAKITVLVGPRAKEIFENNIHLDRIIIYDKFCGLRKKIQLFLELKKEKFDVVIDLRNTFYGVFLPARFRTSPFLVIPRNIRHMKDRNLYRVVKALNLKMPSSSSGFKVFDSTASEADYISSLLRQNEIGGEDKIILINYFAAGANRRWLTKNFAQLCDILGRDYKIILIAALAHKDVSGEILNQSSNKCHDFTGLTNLRQALYLIKQASLLITCDTGILHLASYVNTPTIALFGASRADKYGPWCDKHKVIIKEVPCRPCQQAQCKFKHSNCMRLIKAEDVAVQVRKFFAEGSLFLPVKDEKIYKRILIVRADRIGDVVLSTPVIKALREKYPFAYIAMMVSPYTEDIVSGNPDLDEVIILDKDGSHKNLKGAWELLRDLKNKKFDLAIALHPTSRVHLVIFLAGIPRRIGYDRKMGFLLTDKIKHLKQLGEKYELEYNFDLLKPLGIELKDKDLFVPLSKESEDWVKELFVLKSIKQEDNLLAINPGASCRSKIWPAERFAKTVDELVEKYGFKVFILAGPKDVNIADRVISQMKHEAINLAGKTSVSQLASLLKRCELFISNDSGPVHIASALGTPVVSIFGRSQKGLSPKRWGPVGKRDVFLHKDVGCVECLAHNCAKGFLCLKAITVDDVVKSAGSILKLHD